jgi:hypothetical protein
VNNFQCMLQLLWLSLRSMKARVSNTEIARGADTSSSSSDAGNKAHLVATEQDTMLELACALCRYLTDDNVAGEPYRLVLLFLFVAHLLARHLSDTLQWHSKCFAMSNAH